MTPFRYGSYYDVPRSITFTYHNKRFLLLSDFDDNLDDYQIDYSVYEVPHDLEDSIRLGSWDFVRSAHITRIGSIAVDRVVFDETKRKEIDASFLDTLS